MDGRVIRTLVALASACALFLVVAQMASADPLAPIAFDDAYATATGSLHADAPGVLANDTSPAAVPLTAALLSGPGHGTLTLNADGSFDYQADSGFSGTDSFVYDASDGTLISGPATVSIDVSPAPVAPTAVDDSYTMDADGTLTDNVLTNDVGAAPLTANLQSYPSGGSLTFHTDGSFTYLPYSGFVGADSFTYTVSDGTLESALATVTIDVQANPPANDAFENAIAVGDSGTASGSIRYATGDPSDPYPWALYPTVWYAYTPSHDGMLVIDTCGTENYSNYLVITDASRTPLGAYYASCYNGAGQIAVTSGQTYYFDVSGYYGTAGRYQLNWSLHSPPANDNFANAQPLVGTSGSVAGSTIASTVEAGDPVGWYDVWYSFDAPGDGVLQLDTCGSTDDTAISVTDSSKNNLSTQYGGCGVMNFNVAEGSSYRIAISAYSNHTNDFTLHYAFLTAPPNDSIGAPQALGADSGTLTGDNTAATHDPSDLLYGEHDVWFAYTPTSSGTAIFSSNETSFCNNMVIVEPDGGSGWAEVGRGGRIVFTATAGTTYTVGLDGCNPWNYGSWQLDWVIGTPAANDNSANPESMAGDDGSLHGNNDFSTAEHGVDMTSGGQNNWYVYNPSHDGSVELYAGTSSGGNGEQIAIGQADGNGGFSSIANGSGRITAPIRGGETYYVQVDSSVSSGCGECGEAAALASGLGGGTGDYTLTWSLNGAPPNDLSANAIAVDGNGGSIDGTTLGATPDPDGFTNAGSGVWYVLTPPAYGRLSLSASGEGFTPVISVGVPGSGASTGDGSLQTQVDGTTPLLVEIDGDPSQQGDFTLNWSFQAENRPSNAIQNLGFCQNNVFGANDDGSTGVVSLGFNLNFFGNSYNQLWVNNNGDVTFQGPLGTYTPFNLAQSGLPIIAPAFSDVDTRGFGSGLVHYGTGTVNGHPAFCADWFSVAAGTAKNGVGYYGGHTDKRNTFQLLLVNRDDRGLGDFDITYNYESMQWETGDASGGVNGFGGQPMVVGYSNGSSSTFQLPGSLQSGALTDAEADGSPNPNALILHSLNSVVPGRYVFPVENGSAAIGRSLSGHVYLNDAAHPLSASFIQVCNDAGSCHLGNTGTDGAYAFSGIADGDWTIKAFPPAGIDAVPQTRAITMSGGSLSDEDLTLHAPVPPPPGEGLTPNRSNGQVVYWMDNLTLGAHGCIGGTATYDIDFTGSETPSYGHQTGVMTESAGDPGFYTAPIGTLYPRHGHIVITTAIHCLDGSDVVSVTETYIDPSGTVSDQYGNPILGATVTLFRSEDGSAGSYDQVADGSAIMSPLNNANPDHTNGAGHYGWDVLTGYYYVEATAPHCDTVDTPAFHIPPAVLDANITLTCTTPTSTSVASSTNPSSYGQLLGLTVHVDGGSPGGQVELYDGALQIGSMPLDASANAVFAYAFTSVGDHTLHARYDGDASTLASDSPTLTQSVDALASSVEVTASSPVPYFGPGNVSIHVDGSGIAPAGDIVSVAFDGGAPFDATLDGAGDAFILEPAAALPGDHSVSVIFPGDAGHTGSSNAAHWTVQPVASTTTLASTPSPSLYGQAVSFTATVNGLSPTGSVDFHEGPTDLGSAAVAAGVATLVTSALHAGVHTITADYSGDGQNTPSFGTTGQTVGESPTSMTLTSSANPSHVGELVGFTASVSSPAGAVAGTVTFTVAGVDQPPVPVIGGNAVYATAFPGTGDLAVAATFHGTGDFATSAGSLTQHIVKASTGTTLATSGSPTIFGQAVTLTATVASSYGAPTGTVEFFDGSASLGTAPLAGGTASFATSTLNGGSHSITAVYGGSPSQESSTSPAIAQVVNRAPTSATLTSSVNPSAFGQAVTFTVTVGSPAGVPSGTVVLADGAGVIATVLATLSLDATGHAVFTTSTLAAGEHPIAVTYFGDGNHSSSGGSLTQNVNRAGSTTTVASSLNPSNVGQAVTFTATVTAPVGAPSGTVTFADGSSTLGSTAVDAAGHASLSTSSLGVGSHTITATYGGDATHAGSAGNLSQAVNRAASTTTLTSSVNPSTAGQAVTFTAAVMSPFGVPSGTVSFLDGTTPLATVALDATGHAAYSTSTLAAGSHAIVAAYNGVASIAGSSASLTQQVNPASTQAVSALEYLGPNVADPGPTILVARLYDPAHPLFGSIIGRTVKFRIDSGPTVTGTTTILGLVLVVSPSLTVGTHTVTVTFAGDSTWKPSSDSERITVVAPPRDHDRH